jgi:hypothetical protein
MLGVEGRQKSRVRGWWWLKEKSVDDNITQRHFGGVACCIRIVSAILGERISGKRFLKGKIFFTREFCSRKIAGADFGGEFFFSFSREVYSRNFAGAEGVIFIFIFYKRILLPQNCGSRFWGCWSMAVRMHFYSAAR